VSPPSGTAAQAPAPGLPASSARAWRTTALWLVGAAVPFVLLNTLLTFENRWPGAGVRLGQRLSYELCVGVLLLSLWLAWQGPAGRLGRRALHALAAGVTLLVLLRYANVTAPALLGRPVNLYWDAPHAWQLLRLAADTAPAAAVAAAVAAALAALAVVHAIARWAIARLQRSLLAAHLRPALWLLGAGLTVSWTAHPFVPQDTRWFFSLPITPTLAREAARLPPALLPERWQAPSAALAAQPRFDGGLGALIGADGRGSDVLVLFAEAYGVTTLDHPEHAAALAEDRTALAAALAAGGRSVVSARVLAPTFGGSSWLSHAALLAGVDTTRPLDHDRLLVSDRPTLVSHFAAHGWRTIGWMPGLQRPWPEGAFYGFERLAQLPDIGYRGLPFGYWQVPDQAAAALLHTQELGPAARERDPRPRFVVFPTLSSHAPFGPLPPYVADWSRVEAADAFSPADVEAAWQQPLSWTAATPAYLASMRYTLRWLAGFVRERAPDDLLLIVIGDHQPLASVTGPGAPWDVPVHIISRNAPLLQRLQAAGFTPGLTPPAQRWGAMHELTGALLQAFDAGSVGSDGPDASRAPPTATGAGAATAAAGNGDPLAGLR
jgi:hypothetical protein